MNYWTATVDVLIEYPAETDGKPGWVLRDCTVRVNASGTRKDVLEHLGNRLTKAAQGDRFTLANYVFPPIVADDAKVISIDLASTKATRVDYLS